MFVANMSRRWIIFCSGENMNMFLNENWKDLVRDLAPPIGEALGQVLKTVLTNIYELVPYDEAFPETL